MSDFPHCKLHFSGSGDGLQDASGEHPAQRQRTALCLAVETPTAHLGCTPLVIGVSEKSTSETPGVHLSPRLSAQVGVSH